MNQKRKTLWMIFMSLVLASSGVFAQEKMTLPGANQRLMIFKSYAYLPGNGDWEQTVKETFLRVRFDSGEDREIAGIFQWKRFSTEDSGNRIFPEDLDQIVVGVQGRFEKFRYLSLMQSASDKVFHSWHEINFTAGLFYDVYQSPQSAFSLGVLFLQGDLWESLPRVPVPFFSYQYASENILLMLGSMNRLLWRIIPRYLILDLEGMIVSNRYAASFTSFPFLPVRVKAIFQGQRSLFSLADRENALEKFVYEYQEAGLDLSFFFSRKVSLSFFWGYRFQAKEQFFTKDSFFDSESVRVGASLPNSWIYQGTLRVMF